MKWFLIVALPLFLAGCKPQDARVAPQATPQPTPQEQAFQIQEKADPIAALASLSDPEKLKTLNPEARGVNDRVDKILYWWFVAEQKGIAPAKAIDQAFTQNRSPEQRRSMATKQLESNYRTAKLWGLFTPENCDRLKGGNADLITKGSYAGQVAEVDHTIPLARHPQFANELSNLQLMPASQNRAKGDRMGAAEFEKLKELQALLPSVVSKN